MRRLPLAVVIIASVALVWPLSYRAVSSANDLQTFRVATFNIHKGADRQGDYDLERTIEAIRRLDADVVGAQEVMRNHPGLNCDDQPALIAEGLRQRTGRPWTYVFVKAWITDRRQCQARGQGNDIETEGIAVFASSPILGSHWVRLSEGRVGVAIRVAAMPDVPIVVTHLSPNADNQPGRERELATLLPWAARQGRGLLIGDLNARPEARELGAVLAHYRDGWSDAAAQGRIRGVLSGSTRPGRRLSRIDYVFYAPQINLTIDSAEVFDSTMPGLGEVSDHHPVVITFQRNPPRGR